MAETSKAGEFENALARLEQIVRSLESEGVNLDESVALFQEGKKLARRCEQLLKAAQDAMEAADQQTNEAAPAPAPAPTPTPSRRVVTPDDLFATSASDDDIPF